MRPRHRGDAEGQPGEDDASADAHTEGMPVRSAAWYTKTLPTFADALALVRQQLWPAIPSFLMSGPDSDIVKVPRPLFRHLAESLAYAA